MGVIVIGVFRHVVCGRGYLPAVQGLTEAGNVCRASSWR
ncbi:hypothetical protein PATSB16_31940 [Pandoraea thiooxydans]|nr:hypothetical protein PATSB16_31940 [Pandoraea thiooxydans]